MRPARERSLRAPLALCLAVVLAWVQATGGEAWAPCAGETSASGDGTCCCSVEAEAKGCCAASETTTRRPDTLVDGCGCSHRRLPGTTARFSEPTIGPAGAVSLPDPGADPACALSCLPWRAATRPAPDPPPPRTRA